MSAPTPWGGPELNDDLLGGDWQDELDEVPDDWNEGFSRGWTAAQNAVPDCCLHGPECPLRRPQPRWRQWARRVFGVGR